MQYLLPSLALAITLLRAYLAASRSFLWSRPTTRSASKWRSTTRAFRERTSPASASPLATTPICRRCASYIPVLAAEFKYCKDCTKDCVLEVVYLYLYLYLYVYAYTCLHLCQCLQLQNLAFCTASVPVCTCTCDCRTRRFCALTRLQLIRASTDARRFAADRRYGYSGYGRGAYSGGYGRGAYPALSTGRSVAFVLSISAFFFLFFLRFVTVAVVLGVTLALWTVSTVVAYAPVLFLFLWLWVPLQLHITFSPSPYHHSLSPAPQRTVSCAVTVGRRGHARDPQPERPARPHAQHLSARSRQSPRSRCVSCPCIAYSSPYG